MRLRQADMSEYAQIRSFYHNLIDRMKDQSSVIGWKKGIYPSDTYLSDSIEKGELFTLSDETGYLASVILNSEYNDGYNNAEWRIQCAEHELLVPHALGVRPDVQGRGIGKAVVRDIIETAKRLNKKTIRLDILAGNAAAVNMYKSTGFGFVQTQKMYYEDTGMTEYLLYELIL